MMTSGCWIGRNQTAAGTAVELCRVLHPPVNEFRLSWHLRGRAVALELARVQLTCATLKRNAPARLLLLDMFYALGIVR